MPTLKASKTDAAQNSSQPQPTHRAAAGNAAPKSMDRKSADIEALKIDVDSFESGDPYNRTGQFLVEQLRRMQDEK